MIQDNDAERCGIPESPDYISGLEKAGLLRGRGLDTLGYHQSMGCWPMAGVEAFSAEPQKAGRARGSASEGGVKQVRPIHTRVSVSQSASAPQGRLNVSQGHAVVGRFHSLVWKLGSDHAGVLQFRLEAVGPCSGDHQSRHRYLPLGCVLLCAHSAPVAGPLGLRIQQARSLAESRGIAPSG